MNDDPDKFWTSAKGFHLGAQLKSLYGGIPLLIVFLGLIRVYDLRTGVIILVAYLILITITLYFYFHYRNKRELRQQQKMQDAENKFYYDYFRKKGHH